MNKSRKKSGFSEKQKKRFARLSEKGIFFSLIFRILTAISDAFSKSVTGNVFTSYEKIKDIPQKSFVGNFCEEQNGKYGIVKKSKYRISKSIENSYSLNFLLTFVKRFLATTLRVQGVFLFSFGMYSLAVYLLKYYTSSMPSPTALSLYVSIAAMIIGLGFQTSEKAFGDAVRESFLLKYILFNICELSEDSFALKEEKRSSSNFSFVLGMALGLSTFIFAPEKIALFVFALLFVFLLMSKPEAGILITFVTFAFIPVKASAVIIIITLVSFLIKALRGKRVIKFEMLDFVILFFAILYFVGGAFSKFSANNASAAWLGFCFIFIYFPVKNLMRSSKLVRRSLNALMISFVAVSVAGIINGIFQDKNTLGLFAKIRDISAIFSDNTVLSSFLALLLPLSLSAIFCAKSVLSKTAFFASFVLGIFCLYLTGVKSAYLAFLIGFVIFMLFYSKRSLAPILTVFGLVPIMSLTSPENIGRKIYSVFDFSDIVSSKIKIWQTSANMLKDVFPIGIGASESAFAIYYPIYSANGIYASDAGNSYLQLLLQIGFFGLLAFFAVIFFYMQFNFSYYKSKPEKENKIISAALFTCALSALIQGNFEYIFKDMRVFLLFWIITGLSVAHIKAAKNEKINIREYDFYISNNPDSFESEDSDI